MLYIAVLLTSFNRIGTTLKCLKHFFQAERPENMRFDLFLVDDASPDKTGEIVKQHYPEVNVIQGSGNLYWCGGMRLAWETAASKREYDFYLLLNDDTDIKQDGLITLFSDYTELKNKRSEPFIISGICCDPSSGELTYGGRKNIEALENMLPEGEPAMAEFLNANMLLVPRAAYRLAGGLSEKIVHRFGDLEYSGRVNKKGGSSWVTGKYCAFCPVETQKCFNPVFPLRTRLKIFLSPTGLGLKDDYLFRKEFNNRNWFWWIISVLKKSINCLFPKLYFSIKSIVPHR